MGRLHLAVLACVANASAYVGLLYVWRGDLPRDHPATIRRRLLSTAAACCVSWLPVYAWATTVQPASVPVLHLLGLRVPGLGRAIVDALYLCVTLFAGPLIFCLQSLEPPVEPAPPPARSTAAAGVAAAAGAPALTGGSTGAGAAAGGSGDDSSSSKSSGFSATAGRPAPALVQRPPAGTGAAAAAAGAGPAAEGAGAASGTETPGFLARLLSRARAAATDLRLWRNLVSAPLCEEWVFRASMAPLLVLEGIRPIHVVFLTPVFFGAAHLHHAADLMRHHNATLGRAAATVAFQMLYTTVFGWFATYLFLRTGHLAAPVAAHVFCNWMGFPPFADMMAHPRGIMLMITTAAGAAAFAMALPRMTAPARYEQTVYKW